MTAQEIRENVQAVLMASALPACNLGGINQQDALAELNHLLTNCVDNRGGIPVSVFQGDAPFQVRKT